jgi:excisionase family DNA binding protein
VGASRKQHKTETPKQSESERLELRNSSAQTRMALSVEEAAQAVGLSERYMWNLVRTGKLVTKRIGRRRIVTVDALREFLQ